jgi:hypothetical protein
MAEYDYMYTSILWKKIRMAVDEAQPELKRKKGNCRRNVQANAASISQNMVLPTENNTKNDAVTVYEQKKQ